MRSPRRTPEEWQTILDRFKASGLSQAAFCEQEELKVCTLRYWLYRPSKAEPEFVPVRVQEPPISILDDARVPVSLRVAGVAIEIGVKDCVRILRAVGN